MTNALPLSRFPPAGYAVAAVRVDNGGGDTMYWGKTGRYTSAGLMLAAYVGRLQARGFVTCVNRGGTISAWQAETGIELLVWVHHPNQN